MTEIKKLYDEKEIAARVNELAVSISTRISGKLTVIGVLKGSFVFLADLVRALDQEGCPSLIEFLRLSSYGEKQKTSGDVVLIGGQPTVSSSGTVLLVDDIVDTGNSVAFAKKLLEAKGIPEVFTCTLLDKPSRREVDINIDFVGFTIPDVFVVGYGIDYAEEYRSLPFLVAVPPEKTFS